MKNMKSKPLAVALSSTVLLGGAQAFAETLSLENPDWQEVPGTEPPSDEFFSVYIDMNGLVRRGSRLVFDMIGAETEYVRMEIDCASKRSRQLRGGDFETLTRVQYQKLDDGWADSENDPVTKFVCSR